MTRNPPPRRRLNPVRPSDRGPLCFIQPGSDAAGTMVGVAQLVRAPGCGPGGRGFESPRPPQRNSRSGGAARMTAAPPGFAVSDFGSRTGADLARRLIPADPSHAGHAGAGASWSWSKLPNRAIYGNQGGTATRRRGPALAPGLSLEEARPGARRPFASSCRGSARLTRHATGAARLPSSSSPDCPARGHRLKPGPTGAAARWLRQA